MLIDYFPLHGSHRDEIWQELRLFNVFFDWLFFTRIEKLRPLFILSSYFGARLGMYFAWLSFYTSWLLYISIPGALLAACQLFTMEVDQYLTPLYSLFVSLWVTLMNQRWRQREAELIQMWNMQDVRKNAKERHDYQFEYVISTNTGETTKKPFIRPTVRKIVFTIPVIVFGLLLIVISFILFRVWRSMSSGFMSSIVIGSVNGAVVFVLGYLYTYLSTVLTDNENHQYEDEWRDSYMLKIFCFQFVNCYLSLFAMAFYDRDLSNLAYTVGSNFIVYQFLNHISQLSIYYWYDLWKMYICGRKLANDATFPRDELRRNRNIMLEKSYLKSNPVDPMGDYNEMILQLGYLAMFSSVFPIAPLFAFLRNTWEIRGSRNHNNLDELYSCLYVRRRPVAEAAKGIGIWKKILQVVFSHP